MALIREEYGTLKNGKKLFRIYSDKGMKLIQVPSGHIYNDAVDVEGTGNSYGESNIPVDPEPEETS